MMKYIVRNIKIIYHNKNNSIYSSIFLSNKKKLKSKKENEKWTFINVQKRKSKKSFEKGVKLHFCIIML